MLKQTPVREFEEDREQDEEFVGVVQTELSEEHRFLEAVLKQAIDDAQKELFLMRRGKLKANPIVKDALLWFFIEDEEDTNTPFTFAWVCNELGYQKDNYRKVFRTKFARFAASCT